MLIISQIVFHELAQCRGLQGDNTKPINNGIKDDTIIRYHYCNSVFNSVLHLTPLMLCNLYLQAV